MSITCGARPGGDTIFQTPVTQVLSWGRRCESTAVYGHCQAPTTTSCILREFPVTSPGGAEFVVENRCNTAPAAEKNFFGGSYACLGQARSGNVSPSRSYASKRLRTRSISRAKDVESCGNCGYPDKNSGYGFVNPRPKEAKDLKRVLFQERSAMTKVTVHKSLTRREERLDL